MTPQTSDQPLQTTIPALAGRILTLVRRHYGDLHALGQRMAEDKRRYLLGITGVGGSGKTTLAHQLSDQLNHALPDFAAVLSMDGFHLTNAELDQAGLRDRKGAPETFDPDRLVEHLVALRKVPPQRVEAPIYDRDLHEPVEDATSISESVKLVIVEGNYLLLPRTPWHQIAPLLDAVWFLDTPLDEAMRRIRSRHLAGGRDQSDTDAHIARTDWPNAELILETRDQADLIFRV